MFPKKDDDKKDDKGADHGSGGDSKTHDGGHTPNSAHNAPASDAQRGEAAKHDIAISPGHVNHGPGHH